MTTPSPHRLYIAEDDAAMAGLLAELARKCGFVVDHFADGHTALSALTREPPDALLADIQMPGMNGLELIEKSAEICPGLPVVIITGFATVPDVQRAFRAGAMDLITKPFDNEDVRLALKRIVRQLARERRMESLSQRLAMLEHGKATPVVNSRAMQDVMSLIDKIADLDTPVLLSGETGTGKGVLAQAIHSTSARRNGPWFSVNCGALAESVIESELFGHERGAFTCADSRKRGILELAHTGTLFLDEINSASAAVQTRLLEFVQERSLRRVGGSQSIQVDVRLVIASNQELGDLVKQGRFREDLWYRLNVFPLQLPPLRERRDDIIPLAERFVLTTARQLGCAAPSFSDECEALLQRYSWPGNVRQLENVMHRAVVLADDSLIEKQHLPPECLEGTNPASAPSHNWDADASLQQVEARWIQHMIERCNGNKSEAARRLGIDVSTLHRKLRS
ncbi:MAG: sigma-54 dependent transcriptional regulator [Candidatus Thiodiazotropha lotti]|nr:sigma-54 dependent transcriptional regulator [Candidatus Thiodiazotropha lotti]